MKISDRIGNIEQYVHNPAALQRISLDVLKEITSGKIDVVDATNPFVFAMETTAVNTACFIAHNEAINRRQYPASSLTYEDLYLHMSDKDYVGRFALPSRTLFKVMIRKDELLNALIEDPLTNISKITIPRNTIFYAGEIPFSLQYPIDIKKMQHGGLQIVYDTKENSPLQDLQTNILEWEETLDPNDVAYITFSFDLYQFDIITKYNEVSVSSGFNTKIDFQDYYYHCRVYKLNQNNKWQEILTTHTDQLYNPNKATAVLKVLDKSLSVSIPSIYTNNGLVSGKIRIDLYQTKGDINLLMSNYKLSDFSAKWLAIDENENTTYAAAINDIKTLYIYSTDQTKGGRKSLSLEEQTNRVINNSIGPRQLPITNIQLENSITDAGYEFVKNIDSITNRVYLATKPMIDPIDDKLVTSAASSMSRVTLTVSEVSKAYGVNLAGNRVILTSDCLYKNTNGITRLVSKNDYASLDLLSNQDKVEHLNNNSYSYSPFHYCLDISNNLFNIRPYYLDNPEIISKSFVSENSLSGIQVGISSNYVIEKTTTGYRLTVKTKSNDAFKELDDVNVFCQLAFKSTGESLFSYMLGSQITRLKDTDERIFVFNMESDFDIDQLHRIAQKSFRFSLTSLSNYSDLTQEMHLIILTNSQSINNVNNSETDALVGKFQLPPSCLALSHEKLKIRFGYHLNSLWSRAKSVATSVDYLKYTENIPAKYAEDVYQIDPVTGSGFTVLPNGDIQYNILHRKNDIMRDSQNNIIYKHKVGDIVLDNDGKPIPSDANGDSITRYIDIAMVEGVYRFATDPSTITYRKQLVQSMVDWIINDIPFFNLSLLDQTKIFYYPKVTQGNISCNIGDNKVVSIPASQSFEATLHVPPETLNDSDLLDQIEKITISTINVSLNKNTITVSDIEYELKNKYGKDVIDVVLTGFGTDRSYNAITILDKQAKMSIRKKLILLPNSQLILKEDVKINYIKHQV